MNEILGIFNYWIALPAGFLYAMVYWSRPKDRVGVFIYHLLWVLLTVGTGYWPLAIFIVADVVAHILRRRRKAAQRRRIEAWLAAGGEDNWLTHDEFRSIHFFDGSGEAYIRTKRDAENTPHDETRG